MWAMKPFLLIGLLVVSLNAAPKGWPDAVLEIKYPSKADNSKQPALYYKHSWECLAAAIVGGVAYVVG